VIFDVFSIPPPHLEPEMEMTQVEFFFSSLVFLITGWMEHIMYPTQEATQFKTLGVIHECHRQTHRAVDSKTQIHS
jgi:hypothetical protein